MEFGHFFLPGPTEVHPDVLRAMVRPMIPHRGPECEALFAGLQPVLQELFGTTRPVFVAASSATGMMEAGVRALPPGRVLALVNGAFSERYASIAEACGHEVERLEVAWGEVHDPDAVAARARGAVGVTVVHSETSTGALQPIGEFADAAGDAPLLVDTVSSLAATEVDADARGLSFVCSGSQKALACPPGVAFAVASQALLDAAEQAPARGVYLDLARYAGKQPPFTPALPILYALETQLRRIAAEGVAARFARHRALAERTRDWAAQRGLPILAREGFRSPTVTCFRLPDGVAGPDVVKRIALQGYVVGYGYGKLREATFRIGHMGDQTLETLDGLLAACDRAL